MRILVMFGLYGKPITENNDKWELDKGMESSINYDYSCVDIFFSFPTFIDMSAKFRLDAYILREIIENMHHLSIPTNVFIKYVEPTGY